MIELYLDEIILMLSESPYVDSFSVTKKKLTGTDGYMRVKANLANNEILEISLYCQKIEAAIEIIDYRYHWQDKKGALIRRWDNCRHHKEIETFPFHVHIKSDKTIGQSEKMDVFKILKIIGKLILDRM